MTDRPRLSADDVVVVGDAHITKAMLDRLLEQVKIFYKLAGQAFPRVGSKRRRTLQGQEIQSLVQREMYAQKARELGITITAKQIDDRREQIDEEFKTVYVSESDKLYLERQRQGVSDADVRDSIRDDLIHQALYRKVTARVRVGNAEIRGLYDRLYKWSPQSFAERKEVIKERLIAAKKSAVMEEWEGKAEARVAQAIRYAPGYAPLRSPLNRTNRSGLMYRLPIATS